jgi:multidrug efflux pump subunit AcrA (membrane-fusion protein)
MASVSPPSTNRRITELPDKRKAARLQAQEAPVSLGANRRFLLAGLFLLSATFFVGCSSEEAKPAPPPPRVTVATVVQKDVPIYQEWVGTMAGNIDAGIRPKVDGFLLSRVYQEGSFVEKGQPMFQLDKRQTQAAVEQAQSQFFSDPVPLSRPIIGAVLAMASEHGKQGPHRMVKETGGAYYEVTRSQTIEEIYSQIAEALRNQYGIGYTPRRPEPDGKYHKIKLTT